MDNPVVRFIERTTHHSVHGAIHAANHSAHHGAPHGRLDVVHGLNRGRQHGAFYCAKVHMV